MPARRYSVNEVNQPGLAGDALVIHTPERRNSVLETLAMRLVNVSGSFHPVVVFKDAGGDPFAAAISPGQVNPGHAYESVAFSIGGGEHEGPVFLQGILPLITLAEGFSIEVVLDGAIAPETFVIDLRATFLI